MDWTYEEGSTKNSINMVAVFFKEFGMTFKSFFTLHVNELKN